MPGQILRLRPGSLTLEAYYKSKPSRLGVTAGIPIRFPISEQYLRGLSPRTIIGIDDSGMPDKS
jgi:hypothetical protein